MATLNGGFRAIVLTTPTTAARDWGTGKNHPPRCRPAEDGTRSVSRRGCRTGPAGHRHALTHRCHHEAPTRSLQQPSVAGEYARAHGAGAHQEPSAMVA